MMFKAVLFCPIESSRSSDWLAQCFCSAGETILSSIGLMPRSPMVGRG